MSRDVLATGFRGAAYTALFQGLTMVANFIGSVVLSRLLLPADFGLLAIVAVLMGIGSLLRDFGMGTASLQERSLSDAQASNLFWVNALLSLGAAVVMALSTPFVANVFDDERLRVVVPVMAGVLLITGLQTQYQAKLARELRFTTIGAAGFSAVAAGVVAAVIAALFGLGYWALVLQQIVFASSLLLIYLLTTKWIPSRPQKNIGSRSHVVSGADYGIANALGYLADHIDAIMIGLHWPQGLVGQYNRAFQLFMQPVTAVFGPLTAVVVPTLNRAGSERRRQGIIVRLQTFLVGASLLVLLATAATADWLVPLLLGPGWEIAVSIMQILALGGVFKGLSQINYWSYIITKQSRRLLQSNLVTKPIQILLIVGAAPMGITWVAWAYVIGRAITWPINIYWLDRTGNFPGRDLFLNGLRLISAGVGSFATTRLCLVWLAVDDSFLNIMLGCSLSIVNLTFFYVIVPGGLRELKRTYKAVKGMLADTLRRK